MRKIWTYLFLLIGGQIIFFLIPILIYNKIVVEVSIVLNSLISWWLIKNVEKLYYKKYNDWNSLLYMICPLLGEVFILGLLSHIWKLPSLIFLFKYYLIVYILVYVINIFYVVKNKF